LILIAMVIYSAVIAIRFLFAGPKKPRRKQRDAESAHAGPEIDRRFE